MHLVRDVLLSLLTCTLQNEFTDVDTADLRSSSNQLVLAVRGP